MNMDWIAMDWIDMNWIAIYIEIYFTLSSDVEDESTEPSQQLGGILSFGPSSKMGVIKASNLLNKSVNGSEPEDALHAEVR